MCASVGATALCVAGLLATPPAPRRPRGRSGPAARRRRRSTRGARTRRREAHTAVRPSSPASPRSASSSAAPDDRRDVRVGQRLQAPDAQPRQQRRVDLEVRVLGGGADQRDRAVLDVGQQRVLLRLVEAVDLVDEQHGAPTVQREPLLGRGDRERTSATPDITAESVWNSAPTASARRRASVVLPVPGGPHRSIDGEVAPVDRRAAGRAPRRDAPGPRTPRASAAHPRRERLALRRRPEEGLGSGATGATAGAGPARPPWAARPSPAGAGVPRGVAEAGPGAACW